ncbi:hypothetical protein [uncultured Parasphingorhabdus sp.]|uniref:hypothetical protein n=1 Tax=uncultured Parasphingorhabdus sp. TaxID=2709694 RepID=UPI0030DA6976|tara:strand:- start:29947 stop:30228 length:282 start_codon:yes stop_codon:yes gene_type:complete
MKYLVTFSMIAIAISGTASAKDKNQSSVTVTEDKMAGKEDMGDPTRMICRKQENTGSRLGAKRVCATAAEWDARKQQNRESVERTQKSRATNY